MDFHRFGNKITDQNMFDRQSVSGSLYGVLQIRWQAELFCRVGGAMFSY